MSDRTVGIIGMVASVVGTILAIVGVVFTQYALASFISLLLFENIALAIWFFYKRKKTPQLYPYEKEYEFQSIRYVFENENKMEYEILKVFKVTAPIKKAITQTCTWTGKGKISVESVFSYNNINYESDAKTGNIEFNYPVTHCRFGDLVTTHAKLNIEDETGQNIPQLVHQIMEPTKLLEMQVILKYKNSNPYANFSKRALRDYDYKKEFDLDFDERSRSFRVVLPNPTIGYYYKIAWEK